MHTITSQRRAVNGPAAPPRKRATPSTGGALLLTVAPGRGLTIRGLGLTESEGVASQYLAEHLRPQLDALDAAIRRMGGAA
jgi:hypothetical protein